MGINPRISASKLTNGLAMFNPIRDDMLRTYHSVPQVLLLLFIFLNSQSIYFLLITSLRHKDNCLC